MGYFKGRSEDSLTIVTGITRTNQEWITYLNTAGEEQTRALTDLNRLLLRSVYYTFSKYLPAGYDTERVRMLAEDCTQDALITLLAHLHEFRGESQFTTWAFKFGINKAMTAARWEQWRGVSLEALSGDREPDEMDWESTQTSTTSVEQIQAQKETWEIVRQVIHSELTERQRQVLIWMVFDEVPMDVVTERLDTNRNAIYKLLHDARQKVKGRLESYGYKFEEILHIFS